MLAPTPMLRPSPMDLAGLFGGTLSALKQRWRLLILISGLPTVLAIGTVVAGGAAALAAIDAVVVDPHSARGSLIGLLLGAAAAWLLTTVANLKAQAMTVLAAYEIAQGEHPDLVGVWRGTHGFLLRATPVIAVMFGAVLLVSGSIAAIIVAIVFALAGRSGSHALGLLGVLVLFTNALTPVAWWLRVKFLYTFPSIAIEKLGGIAGLKRAWTLTRGGFWRTLGYYLLGSLAIGTVTSPVVIFGEVPLIAVRFPENVEHLSDLWAPLSASMPLFVIVACAIAAVQVVTEPFMQTYTAYLFIDQVRRSELPPQPAYRGPVGPQGGYYPPPSPYWGPPAAAYPPPPQPGPTVQGPSDQHPQRPSTWQPPTPPPPD